ncbi:MAG: MBL fold metallo-hydrolase [Candidatus ainarchaeum sp.]|nr:MBL fold metallo-hydrolase [Candidatus ainarchaeum sp.]
MIKTIKGKGNSILCNGYQIGSVVIDAPLNSIPPKADLLIITHSHCDHFYGAENYPFKKAASRYAMRAINSKDDNSCLCSYIGLNFPKITIDSSLDDGDILNYGNHIFEIISTPGHCESSICIYEQKTRSLFSGDTIFPDYNLPRTDLPSSNFEKLKNSYEKLSTFDIDTIYPGHGKEIKEKEYIKKLMEFLI